jgi:hypothetical protein
VEQHDAVIVVGYRLSQDIRVLERNVFETFVCMPQLPTVQLNACDPSLFGGQPEVIAKKPIAASKVKDFP